MNLVAALLPRPDQPAISRPFLRLVGSAAGSSSGPTLSYQAIDERSQALAGALFDAGAETGDRVVIQVDKSPDAIALVLGCLRSGLVFIPLNTAYTANEVAYFVEDTGARFLICTPERSEELAEAAGSATVLTLGAPAEGQTNGSGTLADRALSAQPFASVVERAGSDLAAMLYTSGTTGRSKGAMLTHAGLLANAEALRDVWEIAPEDTIVHTLPVFHVHGLFVAVFPLMLQRASLTFCPRFDVDTVLAELPNASVLMGVPTHYIRLLADDRFDQAVCAGVRLFTSGSAPMTEIVHQEFTERTGRHIVERYGMTETGILTSNPFGAGQQVAGTVGFPLPGHDLRVVDDMGQIVDPGTTGMVEVKLPVPFAGYWQLPDKTAETLTDDGWFRTGDVGVVDDTGRLSLDGRASDMIISGGYNVYPKEIELVLDETPGVVESAVVGVPHPDFGEGVIAVIVAEPGADLDTIEATLRAACSDRLARFKHPKQYHFVSALPRNTMAKVQKKQLRTDLAASFD